MVCVEPHTKSPMSTEPENPSEMLTSSRRQEEVGVVRGGLG